MNLGERVKLEREKRGWTLTDLSRQSGVEVGTLSALEIRNNKTFQKVQDLARAVDMSVDDLLNPSTARARVVREPQAEYDLIPKFDPETIEFARAFQKLSKNQRRKWMTSILLLSDENESPSDSRSSKS